jgi:hypothetical protein
MDNNYTNLTFANNVKPSYIHFGDIRICCRTGEVTGLSENITEDAAFFWEQVKEYIIGK